MILMLLMLIFFQITEAKNISLCTGANYYGEYHTYPTTVILFKYSFDISISVASPINPAFPNKVVVSSISFTNYETYNVISPLIFYVAGNGEYVECISPPGNSTICEANLPNGEVHPAFYFTFVPEFEPYLMNDAIILNVNNGELVDGGDGSFLTESNNCRSAKSQDATGYNTKTCCISFQHYEELENIENTCTRFQNDVTIANNVDGFVIQFTTFSTLNWEQNSISMEYNETQNDYGRYHSYGIYNQAPCRGFETCSSTFSGLKKTGDWRYDFFVSYLFTPFQEILVGNVIISDGIPMISADSPYTPENSCWKQVTNIPYVNATVNARFCCVEFSITGTLPPTTTITTTEPIMTTEGNGGVPDAKTTAREASTPVTTMATSTPTSSANFAHFSILALIGIGFFG